MTEMKKMNDERREKETKKNRETVIFFEKGEPHVGEVKKREGKLLHITTAEGREKTISESQAIRTFGASDIPKILKLKDEIDLLALWEAVSGIPNIKELKEEDLISLHNPHFSLEEKIALALKLYSKENIYFKYVRDDLWTPRDEVDVKTLLHKRKEEENREKTVKCFRTWISQENILKSIKAIKNIGIKEFFSRSYPTFQEDIPETIREVLIRLKKNFITGKEDSYVKDALNGIIEFKRQEIFKLLAFFRIIDPYENLFLEKFGVSFESSKLDVKIELDTKEREKIDKPTYSIDLEGTEVRDDAISDPVFSHDVCELLVHIADVSLVDKEEVIKEVIKRGKTIYLPEGKKDMLPQKVVRFLSLDAGVPKPAITFKIKFSIGDRIAIHDVEVSRSEIVVQGNYEFSDEVDVLANIKRIGLALYETRVLKMGGVDLISDDFVILLDEKGELIPERWKVNDMRIVVAEISMLCAYAIGWFCNKNRIPVFFRKSKIEPDVRASIHKFNLEAHRAGFPRQYVIWKNVRASRHMETTVEPSGAESLGYDLYAWGTSPIRRGWDFINIIQISRFLRGDRLFSADELLKIKEKLESSISRVESVEDMRYRYILSAYVMKELADKQISATVVEKDKETIYWIEDILCFLKGKNPQKADVLDQVKVRLLVDPIELKITPIPVE